MKREDFVIKENGKEVMLSVRPPNAKDLEESRIVYSSTIASLIRDGSKKKLLLRTELNDYLRSNKIWTREDDKKIESLQKDIQNLIVKLSRGGIKLSEGRKLALDISDKRSEIVKVMTKRQIFDDATIESVAESERDEYLIYACTVHADTGNRYWASFEDMKEDRGSEVYRKASDLGIKVIYNIDVQYEKHFPENKWLQKYKFINDEMDFIDRKTGERVDKDGRPVKEIEKEAVEMIKILQGDIKEEAPFIDDETGQPITEESPDNG